MHNIVIRQITKTVGNSASKQY